KLLFDIDVLTKLMNYVPVVAGTDSNDIIDGSLFDSSLKNASNDEPQPSSDDEGVKKESGIDDQERPENSTQNVNTVGLSINTASTNVNTGSLNINTISPTVTTAPLEATHADFFGDETEIDMSNITTTYLVPSTLNTRIYKDHSLDHVIGDIQSGVLIRRMTKTTNEQGFLQFKLQQVWTLVDLPYGKRAIGTKWVYRNKKDERVSRIEAIRLFLAYASFKDFVVYQMDVKSAFLYGKIEEEVYVCQPPGFEDPEFPDRVYKVEKALYGLHQTPRFEKMKHRSSDAFLWSALISFLGLQVTQKDDGIFISQDKYVDEILKKFGFSTIKTSSTPIETSKPLLKDAEVEDDSPFDLEAYTNSDYASASLDRKSTIRGCQFLGKRLISWQCKKQTIVANSTNEAEYVAAASCCGQKPWKAKRTTKISHSSRPIPLLANEAVIKEWEDRMERTATTASSLESKFDETKEQKNETKGSKSSLKNSTRCRRNMKILEDLLKKIKITEDIP
ncbi:putative ribonuclease H-like domain-containing protein, partial [Tanacetum coccineum]